MTDKPLNVRIAMPKDDDNIFKILMLAYEENGAMPISNYRVWEMIRKATRQKGGVMGIIENSDKVEGILSLRLARFEYTDDWHLEDICNFVHPDHRKSNHAKDLFQFGKYIAEEMKFPLFIGIITGKRLEAKRRFYQRQAKEVGSVYVHNPMHGLLAEMG